MNVFLSILIGLLTGGLGLLAVGFLANACVRWYRIPSREGGAGYFIIGLALLGGILGTIVGFAAALAVGPAGSGGAFLAALGLAWGIALTLAGLAAAIARGLADVPPTIDGRELELEVEIRLPAGEGRPPSSWTKPSTLGLHSVKGHRARGSRPGELRPAGARLLEGRWVVPGEVFLFTGRGKRVLELQIDGESRQGFLVPLPARPRKEHEEWSGWLPRSAGKEGPPWPDTKPSYRFRVKPIVPPPPPPTEEELAEAKLASLRPDGPLEGWLGLLEHDGTTERSQAVMAVAETRQADLVRLLGSGDRETRSRALLAAGFLDLPAPEVLAAIDAEGREIAAGIRRLDGLPADGPDSLSLQVELRSRFNAWKAVWWKLLQRPGFEGRPRMEEIHDLARDRARGTSMDEIVVNARAILQALDGRTPGAP